MRQNLKNIRNAKKCNCLLSIRFKIKNIWRNRLVIMGAPYSVFALLSVRYDENIMVYRWHVIIC